MSAITVGGAILFVSVLISFSLLKAPGRGPLLFTKPSPRVNIDTSQRAGSVKLYLKG